MFDRIADHRHRFWTVATCGGLCCALIGCGKETPAPTQVTAVPPSRTTTPIVTPAQKPNPQPGGNAAAKDSANGSSKAARRKTDDPFADEDPKNLFEIGESAPTISVPAGNAVTEADRFVVETIAPGGDATQFELLAPNEGVSGTGAGRGQNLADPASDADNNTNFTLPAGFSAVASFGDSREGLPLRIRDEKTGGLMALVPGGLAHVGSIDGPEETRPEFTPFLETFYMDVTEVTLAQYGKFRDDMKQKKNTRVQLPVNDGQEARLPALGVPWGVAQGFAHWAGKELPTEAEFEKASRGPDGFRTPWGNGRAVWPKPRTPELITSVAAFPTDQSVYGIFDLAGNAREWCSDWYSDTAHQQASQAPERALLNWPGPKKASVSGQRVVKGNAPDWSAWHREGRAMADRAADVGFRCVLRVKVSAPTEPTEN